MELVFSFYQVVYFRMKFVLRGKTFQGKPLHALSAWRHADNDSDDDNILLILVDIVYHQGLFCYFAGHQYFYQLFSL